jgi:AbrB family looped-hinge helix DNA binding protein
MKSRLGERGQLTIPKALRERLGLRHGQLMEIREERGQLIVTKTVETDPLDRVYGILETDLTTDQMIREMRGSAEPPREGGRPAEPAQ